MSAHAIPASKYALLPQRQTKPAAPAPLHSDVVAPDRSTVCIAERQRELRLKRKIDQACKVLDTLDLRQQRRSAAIRRLQRANQHDAARSEHLENRILTEMLTGGFDSALGMHREIKTKTCPPAVEITALTLLPAEYLRESLTTAADRIALKAALQRGEEIPGCHLTSKVGLTRK